MKNFKWITYKNMIEIAGFIKFKDVAKALKFHYPFPKIKKSTLIRYKEIMEEISKYKVKEVPNEEFFISMSRPYKWRGNERGAKWEVHQEPGEEYYGAHMRKKGDKATWAIEFSRWQELANLKISKDTLTHYTPSEIMAHFLWEITYCGYTQAPIQRKMKSLNKICDDIQSGKAKTVPYSGNIAEDLKTK